MLVEADLAGCRELIHVCGIVNGIRELIHVCGIVNGIPHPRSWGKTPRMVCRAVHDHARQLVAAGGGISLEQGLIGALAARGRQVLDKVVRVPGESHRQSLEQICYDQRARATGFCQRHAVERSYLCA